jgi:hypothetical protein
MAITIDSHHQLWQYSAGSVPLPQKHVTVWAEKAAGIAPGLRRKASRERNPVGVASTPEGPAVSVLLSPTPDP